MHRHKKKYPLTKHPFLTLAKSRHRYRSFFPFQIDALGEICLLGLKKLLQIKRQALPYPERTRLSSASWQLIVGAAGSTHLAVEGCQGFSDTCRGDSLALGWPWLSSHTAEDVEGCWAKSSSFSSSLNETWIDDMKATSENDNDLLANWKNIERSEMSWEDSFLSKKIMHCAGHRFLSLAGLMERGLCFCLKRGKNAGPSPAVWRLGCFQDGSGEDKNWVENWCFEKGQLNFAKAWIVSNWCLPVCRSILVEFGWLVLKPY